MPGNPPSYMTKRMLGELTRRVSPLRARLASEALVSIRDRSIRAGVDGYSPEALLLGCLRVVQDVGEELQKVNERAAALSQDFTTAPDADTRRKIVLEHLQQTVPKARARRADSRALSRWLDLEALQERENRRANVLIQQILAALEVMRSLVRELLKSTVTRTFLEDGFAGNLLELAEPHRRDRLQAEALETLGVWLAASESRMEDDFVVEKAVSVLRSRATDEKAPLWVQVAALRALATSDGSSALEIIVNRLSARGGGDDFIVRRNCVNLMGFTLATRSSLDQLLIAVDDPSEHVRQELARCLANKPLPTAQEALAGMIAADPSPRVRAVALQQSCTAARTFRLVAPVAAATLLTLLRDEQDTLVLRAALQEMVSVSKDGKPIFEPTQFIRPLQELCLRTESPDIAELAAHGLRTFEVLADEREADLVQRIRDLLSRLREGQSAVLKVREEEREDQAFLRALRFAARGDLAVSTEGTREGYRVRRGEVRRRKLWRFIHEMRHPAPDKRQGYWHTFGRQYRERTVVPPIATAEVTPTTVPGERLYESNVGGWAPFIPQVDGLLASCSSRKPLRLMTSAGEVVLHPPRTFMGCLRAWLRLTWSYQRFASERNASVSAEAQVDKEHYLNSIDKLGFRLEYDRQPGSIAGVPYRVSLPHVDTFLQRYRFIAPGLLEEPLSYLMSDRGNSPHHLAIVILFLIAFFLLRAAYVKWRIRRDRAGIPLTVGGWGTRGKSGTERLKAGMFQGLGYDVVVKTTGCEAMFIHCSAGRPATEVFIYRPAGKATIWEQSDVIRVAAKLKTQVMLWECMALRPRFVEILNHDWMRDELTTVTNAYPDHEDVMGPSGEDVARVIGTFMARGGTTITTEEQMLPILRERAAHFGTELIEVTPLEADLIPQDLLDRFPYEEHPRNIALVAKLAEILGIDCERAIVEMADNVVADIGVLKTYPATTYRTRVLQFSNGMSANERAGFLASWTRLGFHTHDADEESQTSVVTVVNNRADRVPRSRVFARIMVNDISADRHVLIGTNLNGLIRFLGEELDSWLKASWIARPGEGDADSNASEQVIEWLERFDRMMKRVKVSTGGERALRAALERMLRFGIVEFDRLQAFIDGLDLSQAGLDPDGIGSATERLWHDNPVSDESSHRITDQAQQVERLRQDITEWVGRACRKTRAYWDARTAIAEAASAAEANRVFRECYRQVFNDNVIVIWDSHATGDQIIDTVASSIAPGQRGRIIGVQNIKGTGLDFVYRWQSLDRVNRELERLDREPETRGDVLTWLASYADYGVVSCQYALRNLLAIEEDKTEQYKEHEKALAGAIRRLEELEAQLLERLAVSGGPARTEQILGQLERWVDHFDAPRRRKLAKSVIDELVAERCGHEQAARIMRELTIRDKGGWLAKMFGSK